MSKTALETIPGLLIRAEQIEAELHDVRDRLAEEIKAVRNSAREELDGMSYSELIAAKAQQAAALRNEAQNRARTPLQLVMDMD